MQRSDTRVGPSLAARNIGPYSISLEDLEPALSERQTRRHDGHQPVEHNASARSRNATASGTPMNELSQPEEIQEEQRRIVPEDTHWSTHQRVPRRVLEGYHIFFISVSGVLGAGLYLRSSIMLQVGGPLTVLVPFLLLTVLAWLVMQCIGEMICIWPISGALIEFVDRFVDEELAVVVGIAYWLTYAVGFAALTQAIASEARYWAISTGLQSGAILIACPVLLLFLNLVNVLWYGRLEVGGGGLKIVMIFTVCVLMVVINIRDSLGADLWPDTVQVYQKGQTDNPYQAFLIALQTAAYAFIGIEIPAATALEAKLTRPLQRREDPAVQMRPLRGKMRRILDVIFSNRKASEPLVQTESEGSGYYALQFSTIWLPVITGSVYLIAGLLVTLNVSWTNAQLPPPHWLSRGQAQNSSISGFVISAHNSGIPGLASAITAMLIFTALSSANTALYVASRTMYALVRMCSPSIRLVAWLCAKLEQINRFGVPGWAVFVSVITFGWLPFLVFVPHDENARSMAASVLEALSDIGSVCAVFVWACECLAFMRFRHYLHKYQDQVIADRLPYLTRRKPNKVERRPEFPYPYRSPGQPACAFFAFVSCAFLLLVPNGATLWSKPSVAAFFATYFPLLFLAGLWIVLKLVCHGFDPRTWFGKDFGKYRKFKNVLLNLNDARNNRSPRQVS